MPTSLEASTKCDTGEMIRLVLVEDFHLDLSRFSSSILFHCLAPA